MDATPSLLEVLKIISFSTKVCAALFKTQPSQFQAGELMCWAKSTRHTLLTGLSPDLVWRKVLQFFLIPPENRPRDSFEYASVSLFSTGKFQSSSKSGTEVVRDGLGPVGTLLSLWWRPCTSSPPAAEGKMPVW